MVSPPTVLFQIKTASSGSPFVIPVLSSWTKFQAVSPENSSLLQHSVTPNHHCYSTVLLQITTATAQCYSKSPLLQHSVTPNHHCYTVLLQITIATAQCYSNSSPLQHSVTPNHHCYSAVLLQITTTTAQCYSKSPLPQHSVTPIHHRYSTALLQLHAINFTKMYRFLRRCQQVGLYRAIIQDDYTEWSVTKGGKRV